MSLENKTIWITGASSGIGKALAIELSKANNKIILSSRNEANLQTVKEVCSHPENIKILTLDLEDYLSLKTVVPEAISLFGNIDMLINNGGISQRALAIDTEIAIDKRFMDINYMGAIALTKGLLPHFTANKSGHFVTITSVSGKVGVPKRSAYAASKHALHGFFDSLRGEVWEHNIKVTIICPGYIKTDISVNAMTASGEKFKKMSKFQAAGMNTEILAKKVIRDVLKGKRESNYGGKEIIAIYLNKFFPRFLDKKLRNMQKKNTFES
ncbi:MAG: SDR family oxidoreductase [Flavobacteriaceae bacterium]|nr:SDR family oxidoreductase [Flavobacteriaceae bacterium]